MSYFRVFWFLVSKVSQSLKSWVYHVVTLKIWILSCLMFWTGNSNFENHTRILTPYMAEYRTDTYINETETTELEKLRHNIINIFIIKTEHNWRLTLGPSIHDVSSEGDPQIDGVKNRLFNFIKRRLRGRGHRIGKMGRRRLWMAPYWYSKWFIFVISDLGTFEAWNSCCSL